MVDAHAILLKHFELQMAQLCSTVNLRQHGTLPSNTFQNLKNGGHCMEVTSRGGKQTIDPPMLYGVEDEMRRDDVVEEVSGELVDKSRKEDEIPQNASPILRPPHPLPQILFKKTEDGKH